MFMAVDASFKPLTLSKYLITVCFEGSLKSINLFKFFVNFCISLGSIYFLVYINTSPVFNDSVNLNLYEFYLKLNLPYQEKINIEIIWK